jgi:hypothetical protein
LSDSNICKNGPSIYLVLRCYEEYVQNDHNLPCAWIRDFRISSSIWIAIQYMSIQYLILKFKDKIPKIMLVKLLTGQYFYLSI